MLSISTATHSFTTYALLILSFCGLPLSNAAECSGELECSPDLSRLALTVPNFAPTSRFTNAERLARGLPLKPPTRRYVAHRAEPSSVPLITYRGVLQVFFDSTSLGYVAADPNFWTPFLTPVKADALQIEFQLSNNGSQIQFQQLNDGRGPILGLVESGDSTSPDIALGSSNYLYFDPVLAPGTAPGATPQNVPSYFSTTSGLNKQAETSVFRFDSDTGNVAVQWINRDSSSPVTFIFVASNHLYAGGDPAIIQSRFSAPVNVVTLKFVITRP